MLGQPGTQIGFARLHVGDANLVTLEQVRDDRQIATLGEFISEQLGVGEDAEDIGQEDDGLLGGLVVLGVGDVGVDWKQGRAEVSSVYFLWSYRRIRARAA